MPSEPHLVLGDYKTVKTLGKGAFSKVKLAVHVDTGTQVLRINRSQSKSLINN
jgi:serine/threonine protein kinase